MLDNDAAELQTGNLEGAAVPVVVTSPVDDLPRPPRGRRAATRPAGPPDVTVRQPQVSSPMEARTNATSAEEEPLPAAPVGLPATSDAVNASDDAVAANSVDQAPAEPVRARAPRTRRPKVESVEPDAMDSGTDHVGSEAVQSLGESAEAKPRTPARRRSTRKAAQPATESSAEQTAADIEAALSAVEAAAPRRSRRPSRAVAAPLLGDQLPAEGEIDTQQVLASLVAAIAGHTDSMDGAATSRRIDAIEASEPKAAIGASEPRAAIEPGTSSAATVDLVEAAPGEEVVEQVEQTEGDEPILDVEPGADVELDDLDEQDDDQADDDGGAAVGSTSQRRRRRRGGRRRRRGAGTGAGEDSPAEGEDQTGDETEADEGADGEDEAAIEEAGAEAIGSSASRRRRRRRRRGDDAPTADDEQGDVVVRVREPRRASDEISGIEGSTRLEAKKQRRREGRAAGRHRAPILSEAEFLARRESVERVMLVRQRDDYTQVAVLEDGVLVEHYVDRSASTSLIGNIYLGRVQNVLPSMEAVFIDIGRGRNAVLYAGEVDWDAFNVSSDSRKVEQVFKSGQSVLVQVSKDPVGAKGARLTGHVSLPGRYVVYSPGGHLSGISRKLPDSERQRLKQILDSVVAEESSVIVRTAAEGATAEELVSDVERLQAQWQVIEKKSKQGSAPQQLYAEPDLTRRIIRDTFTEDFRQLVVNGNGGPDDAYEQIAPYVDHLAPHLAERVVQWNAAEGDPFAKFRIDEQISKALERKVFLPSGGSLVIDRTEAMTVIDVNTGKFTGSGGNLEETITRNNLEAAEEVVRQLRLRDIGGIIVIDFIDMVLPNNRELLLRRLVECLGRDRTRHQVSEVTSLGLVQMTRKRIGTGLAEAFTDVCECCGGRGYVRHDEPVESQEPSDGGERRGAGRPASTVSTSSRGRGRAVRTRASQDDAPKATAVQPSEAAKQAAAKLAAASRHHVDQGATTDEESVVDLIGEAPEAVEQAPEVVEQAPEVVEVDVAAPVEDQTEEQADE